METDGLPPGSEGARDALVCIGVARRRLALIEPPTWVYWILGLCQVLTGLAQLLRGAERIVVELLVLAVIFVLAFAVQRRSGVITRLTRPPARPLRVWIVFIAIVLGGVELTNEASHVGQGPLGFFALGALIVIFGPRLGALWRRAP